MPLYLGIKLQKLFPNTVAGVDWELLYENGVFTISKWTVPGVQKPSVDSVESSITDLDIVKDIRTDYITSKRNKALETLTASWDGDTWDANEDTSSRIANALSMVREASSLGIPTPPAIPWRTYDNQDRNLTIAELTMMGASVFLAQQTVWGTQAQLKNAIEAASTVEEVNAIDW